jgi:hypothetical protein
MLVAARFNPGERMTASLFKARWIKTEEALVEKALHYTEGTEPG